MKVSVCVTWLLCCLCLEVWGHPPSGPTKYSAEDPTAHSEPQPSIAATPYGPRNQVSANLSNTSAPPESQQTMNLDGFNPINGIRRGTQRLVDGVHQGLVQGLQEYFTSSGSPQSTLTSTAGVQYAANVAQPDPFNSYNQQPYSGLVQQGQNYNRENSYLTSPTYSYANQPAYPRSQQSSGRTVNYRPGTQYTSPDLGARRPAALAPQQPEVLHEGRGTASVSQWFRKDQHPNNRNAVSPQYQVVNTNAPSSYHGSSNSQQQSYQPSSSSQLSSLPSYQSSSTGQASASPSYYSEQQGSSSPSYYSSAPQTSYVPSSPGQVSASPSYYSSAPQTSYVPSSPGQASASPSYYSSAPQTSYVPSSPGQASASPSYYSSAPQTSYVPSTPGQTSASPSYYSSAPQSTSSGSASYAPLPSTQTSSSPSYLTSSNQAITSPYHLSPGDQISSSYHSGASEPSPGYLNYNSHNLGLNVGDHFGDHFDFNDADSHSY